MVEVVLNICKKNIKASVIYESTLEYCKGYLATDGDIDFTVEMTEEDIQREREIHLTEGGFTNESLPSDYLEPLALYRKMLALLIPHSFMMFHGSAIAVDGECFIFTALSGTGKSTHTRLWREYFGDRAVMVNDDKPIISVTEKGTFVHGTPWNGKHNLGSNITVPLKAVCILERAEDNSIASITKREAFPMLYQQTYKPKDPVLLYKTINLIERLADGVGLYRLGCNMDISAAKVSYEGMKKGN